MNIECTKMKREAFDVVREGIDNTFGVGTSQTVSGDCNTLSTWYPGFSLALLHTSRTRDSLRL